jgi:AcrR family transcriptional regulator
MPKTGLTSTELKDRAIGCTIEHMRRFGYEKVRLSDIAKDLGITHAALYSHFADKSALFDAVSERWLLHLDERLAKYCDGNAKGEPLNRIVDWFVTLHKMKCERVRQDPELYRAFNFSAQMEKPFVRRHVQAMNKQLEELVRQAIARKQISGNIVEISEMLLNATIGFHHPELVADHINEDREKQLRKILKVLFKGFAKKS